MKIAISYPPLESSKGTPLLSQNRQFQWFHAPTYIYPMMPAYAATLLKRKGYEVVWDDAIAARLSFKTWMAQFERSDWNLIAIESKTPTIKKYWKIIDHMKKMRPDILVVLMGDHVTAFPQESLEKSQVDYVLTGGDFDLNLLNLANSLSQKTPFRPGVYYRQGSEIVNSGPFQSLAGIQEYGMIDRDLTQWHRYSIYNGNYKYLPGTYTMIGRDCWWRREGGCTFCSWTTIFPKWQMGTAEHLLEEVDELVHKYGVREIFDDTGTFPGGRFLQEFCEGMIRRGLHKKVVMGCNMKPAALDQDQYHLMGKANFRFILYGIESANDKTLEKLNKGNTVQDIRDAMYMAKRAGLEPHVTCMVGYPWETKEEALETIRLTKDLFDRGWIDTLQATIVIPYPGTELFRQAKEQGWLLTEDWDDYDMRKQVMKGPLTSEEVRRLSQGLYKSCFTPRYLFRKLSHIRSVEDVKFYYRAARQVVGHLMDFKPKQKDCEELT
ncbi:MAG: radical SAM protein [Deltaproteobacteria bacterium]|nr:radical SAM protein [Deltaproteobacteria bacterium]